MILNRRELLTQQQREALISIPFEGDEHQMSVFYMLSIDDIEIINKHRKDFNKLGFALQLALLRYPGCSISNIKNILYSVVKYIADQLDLEPEVFNLYAERDTTKREHLEEICIEYGYKNFSKDEDKFLLEEILNYAMENDNSTFLDRKSVV